MKTLTTEPTLELLEIVKFAVLAKDLIKDDTSQFSIDVVAKADLILQEYDKYLSGNEESKDIIQQTYKSI